ncbi:hypothetical protein Rhow_005549 [Rhodococcus wratislaviensis]|uniref:Uncharacterized protein n=1 Tax=Rhodococcus wratislaviensis TaxID=44752 RepID=A0A402CE57_RHOWR|nr:hypothetical protein Rhow_005549 [Rhodococcus wratislaviensis]
MAGFDRRCHQNLRSCECDVAHSALVAISLTVLTSDTSGRSRIGG